MFMTPLMSERLAEFNLRQEKQYELMNMKCEELIYQLEICDTIEEQDRVREEIVRRADMIDIKIDAIRNALSAMHNPDSVRDNHVINEMADKLIKSSGLNDSALIHVTFDRVLRDIRVYNLYDSYV